MQDGVDAVTAGLLLHNASNVTWEEHQRIDTLRLFDFGKDRLLTMQDMLHLYWVYEPEVKSLVIGSRNVPHYSPMFRKSLHQWLGGNAAHCLRPHAARNFILHSRPYPLLTTICP